MLTLLELLAIASSTLDLLDLVVLLGLTEVFDTLPLDMVEPVILLEEPFEATDDRVLLVPLVASDLTLEIDVDRSLPPRVTSLLLFEKLRLSTKIKLLLNHLLFLLQFQLVAPQPQLGPQPNPL